MNAVFRLTTLALLLLALSALTGCQSFNFYRQAIQGQARLLLAREPVSELLMETNDPALRERLELVGELLAFAESKGLATGGAYRSYVETGRPFVVWNVFAAPPYELALMTHCFPIAGCVSYRGYFSQADAERYAADLAADGLDTWVGGVAAYSTLGWFEDPLLDTFLFRPEDRLAALIFHELAHQLVYVPGDTRFNESVATAVEHYLLRAWLVKNSKQYLFEAFERSLVRRQAVLQLIEDTRAALREVYASTLSDDEKSSRKQAIFDRMRGNYSSLRQQWVRSGEPGNEFSGWVAGEMNNAKLETVADYNEWVPALATILEENGMAGFEVEAEKLAKLDADERAARLRSITAAGSTTH